MRCGAVASSRLLKKAHLRSPSHRLGTRLLGHSLRRTRSTPHSALRAPPGIWTFLSSLGESGSDRAVSGRNRIVRKSAPFSDYIARRRFFLSERALLAYSLPGGGFPYKPRAVNRANQEERIHGVDDHG